MLGNSCFFHLRKTRRNESQAQTPGSLPARFGIHDEEAKLAASPRKGDGENGQLLLSPCSDTPDFQGVSTSVYRAFLGSQPIISRAETASASGLSSEYYFVVNERRLLTHMQSTWETLISSLDRLAIFHFWSDHRHTDMRLQGRISPNS